MLKKYNSVHLDGVLVAFQMLGERQGMQMAWASVMTLHPKAGVQEGASPSDMYLKMQHDVRITAGPKEADLLRSIEEGFKFASDSGEVFPCSVDGSLYSDGVESFVGCRADNLRRNHLVKTNGNNRVYILGEVISTSYTDETARIVLRTDEGELSSFIARRQNQACWDMVVDGKIAKGALLSVSGPLLSAKQTSDGKNYLRSCMVTPHVLHVQKEQRRTTRKGVRTI